MASSSPTLVSLIASLRARHWEVGKGWSKDDSPVTGCCCGGRWPCDVIGLVEWAETLKHWLDHFAEALPNFLAHYGVSEPPPAQWDHLMQLRDWTKTLYQMEDEQWERTH